VNSEPVHFDSGIDPGREAFSSSSPKLDRLIDGVRSLEQWYAADFERRIAGVTELLKQQITEELRTQFTSELNLHVERIRTQYEERVYTQASQWESQKQLLEREIDELKRKLPDKDVYGEIASAEAVIGASADRTSMEVERLLPDAAAMGRLLQARIEEMTMKAYLRGLKFRLPQR
jgi:hypothetical protein